MKSGIYKLFNKVTEKFYIGSAVNFRARWTQHKSKLRSNKHPNKFIQASWNLHGEDVFEFIILEYCEKDVLLQREQIWLDQTNCYDRNIGYNLTPTAGSALGTKWTEERKVLASERMKKFKHTEEAKEKMRNREFSKEHKANLSAAKVGHSVSDETKLKIKSANVHLTDPLLRERQRAAVSKPEKWQHGFICKCRECKDKKNEYHRNYMKSKEAQNVQA